jgi:hypothetical protein
MATQPLSQRVLAAIGVIALVVLGAVASYVFTGKNPLEMPRLQMP